MFGANCAFCTTRVNRLEHIFPNIPALLPWQWLHPHELELTHDDVMEYAWATASTHQHVGHLALSALPRMQPSLALHFEGNLLATPPIPWAVAAGSHFVAKNQQRLPKGTRVCAMPPTGA